MSTSETKNIDALAIRGLPTAVSNNTRGPVRADRYGNVGTRPYGEWRKAAADQGTYWCGHNATNDAATTLAGHAAPVLVDADATMTKPFLHFRHTGGVSSLIRVQLDFIQIEVITAGANGTADSWASQLDTGATRVSSGGTALTLFNPNMQVSGSPVLAVLGGAVVTGAETAQVRDTGFGQFRPSIQVAGDKYTFLFGGDPAVAGTDVSGTIMHHTVAMPAITLGPTDQFLLALYSPSQSAAGVYKVRLGWTEE